MVISDQSGNSYSDPNCNCTANTLVIEHQDGPQTSYYHFPQNGVYPQYGDQVARGAKIGVVGNTGYSTGPHLHIQVNPVGDLQSEQFKFEVKLAAQGNVKGCYIPVQGEQLWSTN
jgi:murein DD-endopeptidase MepM/ murein hydrolase activator NlpD